MYKLKAGTYGNIVISEKNIVRGFKKEYSIFIFTDTGTLKVFGLKFKITSIHGWLHRGPWMQDYKDLVKAQKTIDKAEKYVAREEQKIKKEKYQKLNVEIKQSYKKMI